MTRADLILHPVRLRIILAFARGRRLTPQQVAALLADVPQATLYRQIERLFQGGVLAIAAEKRVRAAVDFSKDGVGYRQLVLHLSDAEFAEMVAALNAAIGPFLAHRSRPGRKRRAFATVL